MSRPQDVHTGFPVTEDTARAEEEQLDKDEGEYESSSKISSGPEEFALLGTELNISVRLLSSSPSENVLVSQEEHRGARGDLC